MYAAATGVIDLQHGIPADLALDGEIPGVHFRIAVIACDGADTQSEEGGITL